MSPSTENRINEAAKRLAEKRVSRAVERRSATLYVRSTKAIDSDTRLSRRSASRSEHG